MKGMFKLLNMAETFGCFTQFFIGGMVDVCNQRTLKCSLNQ